MSLRSVIKEYEEMKGRLTKYVKESAIEELFAEFPTLEAIAVRGWTPGFNDGDPCTHSQESFLCAEDDILNELFGYDEETGESCKNLNLEEKDVREIYNILYTLEDIFYDCFGTDWQLTAERTEEGIKVEKTDYDCGY